MPAAIAVPAILGAVGIGGSVAGAVIGSKASTKAADIQQANAQKVAQMSQDAATKAAGGVHEAAGEAAAGVQQSTGVANNLLGGVVNLESQNLQPYLDAGHTGVNNLLGDLAPGGSLTQQFSGPNPADVSGTPEYQFQLQQGLQALQRAKAATGGLQGGDTLKAITQYGQGLASTSYQQAYNNALNTFQTNRNNTLLGINALTSLGTTGTANYNNALQNFGNTSSTNLLNSGIYSGNADINAATQGGNYLLQGTDQATRALTGGANAQAQGTVNSASSVNSGIGGAINSGIGSTLLGYLLNNPAAAASASTPGPTTIH